ncbi:hypothetical protein [Luteibacter aegosomatissinici]|uniref:hypothetical protein n=1 Tax=Luteibacter aegosomatissinici TaxID=2911539 RepID=UPI001FF99401|nr:hypothetical protein [Luteibacter aegosomatissinici]UPG94161.1 hypothetical protein L2Y97_20435 [Luteibacter aegosomatissinici]
MLRTTLAVMFLTASASAFAADVPPERFVDATDWPTSEAGMDRFFEAEARLNAAFDKVCGDTFCEGEFSNLRPMQLRCSVDTGKNAFKQCLWTFAGSRAKVNAKTGAVQVTAKTFKCKLLLARDTSVDAFYELAKGEDPLHAKLPMTNVSIYDGLPGCLN